MERVDRTDRCAAQAGAIDRIVPEYALHVLSGFLEWDQFDPYHRVDVFGAWIAIGRNPFVGVAATRIVRRGGEQQRSVVGLELRREVARAELRVVLGIGCQLAGRIAVADLLGRFLGGRWYELHQLTRARGRYGIRLEPALCPRDGVDCRHVDIGEFGGRQPVLGEAAQVEWHAALVRDIGDRDGKV